MVFTKESAKKAAAAAYEARKANKAKREKSGDSKLQDGAAAREEERTKGHQMSPQERREHLPAELQDAAELKRAAGDYNGADVVSAALASLTAIIQGMSSRLITLEGQQGKRIQDRGMQEFLRCPTCQQAVMKNGRGVCSGEHQFASVVPKSHELIPDFDGYFHNGICYRGASMLPVSIYQDVMAGVSRWEMKEKEKKYNIKYSFGGAEVGPGAKGLASVPIS